MLAHYVCHNGAYLSLLSCSVSVWENNDSSVDMTWAVFPPHLNLTHFLFSPCYSQKSNWDIFNISCNMTHLFLPRTWCRQFISNRLIACFVVFTRMDTIYAFCYYLGIIRPFPVIKSTQPNMQDVLPWIILCSISGRCSGTRHTFS